MQKVADLRVRNGGEGIEGEDVSQGSKTSCVLRGPSAYIRKSTALGTRINATRNSKPNWFRIYGINSNLTNLGKLNPNE